MPDKSVTVSPADVAKVVAAKLAAKRTAENCAKIRKACGHDDDSVVWNPITHRYDYV